MHKYKKKSEETCEPTFLAPGLSLRQIFHWVCFSKVKTLKGRPSCKTVSRTMGNSV